jgi:hypothetical protein
MRPVDADAGHAHRRELLRGPSAGHEHHAVGVAHSAIHKRPIASAARAHEDGSGVAVGACGHARNGHEHARRLGVVQHQLTEAAVHPAAAGGPVGRLATLEDGHVHAGLVHAVGVEDLTRGEAGQHRQRVGEHLLACRHQLVRGVTGAECGHADDAREWHLGVPQRRGGGEVVGCVGRIEPPWSTASQHVTQRGGSPERLVGGGDHAVQHHRHVERVRGERGPLVGQDPHHVGRPESLHVGGAVDGLDGDGVIGSQHPVARHGREEHGARSGAALFDARQRGRVDQRRALEVHRRGDPGAPVVVRVDDVEHRAHEVVVSRVGEARHVGEAVGEAVRAGEGGRVEVRGRRLEVHPQVGRVLVEWGRRATTGARDSEGHQPAERREGPSRPRPAAGGEDLGRGKRGRSGHDSMVPAWLIRGAGISRLKPETRRRYHREPTPPPRAAWLRLEDLCVFGVLWCAPRRTHDRCTLWSSAHFARPTA